jgi:uncharacterized zinc-type alcohol dehydrogenase-like protein
VTSTIQAEQRSETRTTPAYGTPDANSPLRPMPVERREPGAHDVAIEIDYCGVCHSDVHQARDEWHNTVWPCVPGHEIVGRVTSVGRHVTKFAAGDLVGVGCMVDSCRHCEACRNGDENYCEGPHGFLATYNGWMNNPDGTNTFGGYSSAVVVNEDFVLRIPAGLEAKLAAPLLCSGVTTFSPLKHFKIGHGDTIGVAGIGGLGHVAIQIAKALGATVVALTRNPDKAADAKRFGASDVVVWTDGNAMKPYAGKLDFILSTIPTSHPLDPFLALLKRDGRMTICGALEPMKDGYNNGPAAFHRISLGGSLIGSIEETQAILDLCAAHGIAPEIELIDADRINEAFDNIVDCKVRYRYVIDTKQSRALSGGRR